MFNLSAGAHARAGAFLQAVQPAALFACVIILAFMPCSAAAQTLSPAEQASVDKVFERFTKSPSPGCALGIYRNGEMAYARGYGMASLELGVPITPQTVFDIGSTSKQFTAFSILLLQKEGKLSVDDDIRKFIPEFPDYGKTISLRHLLTHTSGLRDYTALFDLAGVPEQDLTTDQDALDLLLRQRGTNFAPGTEWDYSNSGFFLLSQVVQRVSGKTLRDFDAEHIFGPLTMSSTQIFNEHTLVIAGRATGYSYNAEKKTFGVEMSNFEQTGDGSVQTSVADLLHWDENFYSAKIGGRKLLDEMQAPGQLNDGESHGYGFGLFLSTYRGQPIVDHGGAWAGYRADLLRFPRQHTSVAVLCNLAQSHPTRLARGVTDVVLASALQPKPADAGPGEVQAAPAELQARAGTFRNEKGEYQRLAVRDGKLTVPSLGGIELAPASNGVFRYGSELTLTFTGNNNITVKLLEEKPVTYTRIPAPVPEDPSVFAGSYYSPDLDVVWEFGVHDGQLTRRVRKSSAPPEPTVLVDRHTYMSDVGTITFEAEPGKPYRAMLSAGRIRLTFVQTK
jgi:CubicO group peptidase (beta-lactamase class C family)